MLADIERAGESGAVWDGRPFRIVSLLEMNHFFAGTYGHAMDQIKLQFYGITALSETRGQHAYLTEVEAKILTTLLGLFEFECRRSGLNRPSARFIKFNGLKTRPNSMDLENIKWELKELLQAAVDEGFHKKFFVVHEDVGKYYNLKHPFGEAVFAAFESAVHDTREAKNCYAVDRHTACVFHCMRVLEKGLHALVHHLNRVHSAGITFSKTVEGTNWGNIIDEIQIALENPKRVKRLNPLPDNEEMRFYSKLSLEFDYFNEAWRKDVSHSRSSYDETAAKSVMEHVERFMRQLVDGLLVRAKISVDASEMDRALDELEVTRKRTPYTLKPYLESRQTLAQLTGIPLRPSPAGLACEYRVGFKLSNALDLFVPASGTGNPDGSVLID